MNQLDNKQPKPQQQIEAVLPAGNISPLQPIPTEKSNEDTKQSEEFSKNKTSSITPSSDQLHQLQKSWGMLSYQVTNGIQQYQDKCPIYSEQQKMVFDMEVSLNEGDTKVEKVICLKKTTGAMVLGICLSILTAGILFLICQRNNKLFKYFFFGFCSIEEATHFLIQNYDGNYLLQKKITISDLQGNKHSAFVNRHMTYFYNSLNNKFRTLDLDFHKLTAKQILNLQPLKNDELEQRKNLFGPCLIDFPIPSVIMFFYYWMTNPVMFLFYLSIFIWFVQKVVLFAVNTIWVTLLLFFFLYLYERRSRIRIRDMARQSQFVFRVCENGQVEKTESKNLVPGDLIKIRPQTQMLCDVVLIDGETFVNESNITGESDPVPKIKLVNTNRYFDYFEHSSSIIYEGSDIINSSSSSQSSSTYSLQDENYMQLATGLVLRTGFSTRKGQVIRKSLFPKIEFQQFQISELKYCIFFMTISVINFLINIKFMYDDSNISEVSIWVKLGEGIIDFGAAVIINYNTMSLSTGISRLSKKNIQSTVPNLVTGAALINMVCFDKTGTVTENTINVVGFWGLKAKFVSKEQIEQQPEQVFKQEQLIQKLMATCHSAQVHSLEADQIIGDMIDVQMFKNSNYKFANQAIAFQSGDHKPILCVEANDQEKSQLQVLKRFEFKSEFASQSVIVKDLKEQKMFVFVKGSHEKLRTLCNQSSIPDDFENIQNQYSIEGMRVLALAYREIDLSQEKDLANIHRIEVEKNLNFLGFIILDNPLKKDSKEAFQRLLDAELALKIISGDQNLTVTHTAVQLNLITLNDKIHHIDFNTQSNLTISEQDAKTITPQRFDDEKQKLLFIAKLLQNDNSQLSITGRAIDYLFECRNKELQKNSIYSMLLPKLIIQTKIFSRCTPDLKRKIIQEIKMQKVKVAMVGDGANDCKAIQEANIGISFTASDAALTAPFCTTGESIDCVEKILLEGRGTMSNNYEGAHIYLTVSFLRYIMHIIEVYSYQMPNDVQNLLPAYYGGYVFFFWFHSWSRPAKKLSKQSVQQLLCSNRSLLSTAGRWSMMLATMLAINFTIKNESFYTDPTVVVKGLLNKTGHINTALFYLFAFWVSAQQFGLYTSGPAKLPMYKNKFAVLLGLSNVGLATSLFFVDEKTIGGINLVPLSDSYRIMLFLIAFGVQMAMIIWDKIIIPQISFYEDNKITCKYDYSSIALQLIQSNKGV